METRPDVLVLGGGGRAGIAWITGVLAGLEDGSGLSLAGCDHFVGTSAGAVVAARLAAGEALRRPAPADAGAVTAHTAQDPVAISNLALALFGPAAAVGVRVLTGPGALARRTALRLAPADRKPIGSLVAADASWDGRLRVVAVERLSGHRVVFGSPGAPDATVDDAVRASCSAPWLFAPVAIGGVEYVDGCVWSPTSLEVAPVGRETRLLCLCPTASAHGPLPLAVRATSHATTLVEASVVTGRGARVRLVAPDRESAAAIGRDLMAPGPAASILAAGYHQGLGL